jgi:hypothetical protein
MKYRVEGGVAEIGADMLLRLSDAQVAARRHALEQAEDGKQWRARHVLQFKSGEELGIDCDPEDLPRSLSLVLVPLGKRRKTARDKAPVDQSEETTDEEGGDTSDDGEPEGDGGDVPSLEG